jgi:hypothetical protein
MYKFENPNNLNTTRLEQAMANTISKARETLQCRLVKLVHIADPKLGLEFLQQIKIHY